MFIILRIYPTFGARNAGVWEDLTSCVFTQADLNLDVNSLCKKAEKFCRLNSYYGYDLVINNQTFTRNQLA